MNRQKLVVPKAVSAEKEVAVTAGADVDFSLTVCEGNHPVPSAGRITGVRVYPHNAASPKVAVSTIWRLRFYSGYDRAIDEVLFDENRFGLPTSSEKSLNSTVWHYKNKQGRGEMLGTISIQGGATDCTFTIGVEFDRGGNPDA